MKPSTTTIDDILHPAERRRIEITQLAAGIRCLDQIIAALSQPSTPLGLHEMDTATLQVMQRTLTGRGNDSTHEHSQLDQLAAVKAELNARGVN